MRTQLLLRLFPLLLIVLACQPVIAIGRNEFLLVLLLIAVQSVGPKVALAVLSGGIEPAAKPSRSKRR